MKLSEGTVEVLKNFAGINPNIIFSPGTQVVTMSPMKSIIAKAKVTDEFPEEFAIYDLNKFLGFISRFNDPKFNFKKDRIEISNDHKSGIYEVASTSIIVRPPKGEVKLPNPEISFNLSADVIKEVLGDAAVLGLTAIAIQGDGKVISIAAVHEKGDSIDTSKIPVGTTDAVFNILFLAGNFKMLPRDYAVVISSKGGAHFVSDDVEYFVAFETKLSHYDG